jgi:hypothetical protein
MKKFLPLLLFWASLAFGQATVNYGVNIGAEQPQQFVNNVYISQSGTGAQDGLACGTAKPLSYFNTSGNWTASASTGIKIGPGTGVHLCGTFNASAGATGYISFQGSGTASNPVTLLFESGAVVQAPYWGGNGLHGTNGAIYLSGRSNIVIDGGANGLIQATLNGTSGAACPGGPCTNQQASDGAAGIYMDTKCSNVEIKNLNINNLYVHTSLSDESGGNFHEPNAIQFWGGSGIKIHDNTSHDLNWFIYLGFYTGYELTGDTNIYNNTVYNISLGIGGGDGATSATTANVNIYGNTIHDMTNWDDTANNNHHDGIYIWLNQAGSTWSGAYNVYNNRIYNIGTHCTATLYFDNSGAGAYPNATAFNNVISPNCNGGEEAVYDKSGQMRLYNNTFTDATSTINSQSSGTTQILENNISAANTGLLFGQASITISNWNDWWGLSGTVMTYNNVGYSTFALYKSGTGLDANSITTNPNLDANFKPQGGSPVIGTGTNLYSTCNGQPNPGLGALCFDKAGNARPSAGGWDMGAFNH